MLTAQELITGQDQSKEQLDAATIQAMRYPSAIIEWELEHHIVREERNGMVYIRCVDFDAFNEQIEREKEEFKRRYLRQRIAAAQDAAYLGEQQEMQL